MRFYLYVIIHLSFSPTIFSQQKKEDTLLKTATQIPYSDSLKIRLYLDSAKYFQTIDTKSSLAYAEKAVESSRWLKNHALLSAALASKGNINILKAEFRSALETIQEALQINVSLNDKKSIANNYNNLGLVYSSINDYPKALEYYHKSLTQNENLNNITGKINNLGNIGIIYNALNQPEKAIDYFTKALVLNYKQGNKVTTSGLLNNIGNSYTTIGDMDMALEYKLKALEINNQDGNELRIANSMGNLGNVYFKMKNYTQALQYQLKALAINEKHQNKKGLFSNYYSLGDLYLNDEKIDIAKIYFTKAYQLALSGENLTDQTLILEKVSLLFERSNQLDSAYYYFVKFIDAQKKTDNSEKLKLITQATLKYDFSRIEDSLKLEKINADSKLKEQLALAIQQQQKLKLQEALLLLSTKQKQIQHLAFLKTQSELKVEQSTRAEKEKKLELAEKEKKLQQSEIQLQNAEINLKTNEIKKQNILRTFFIIGILFLSVLVFLIFRNFRIQKKNNTIIEKEREKSDLLLLNILPKEIALELKEKGSAEAKYFEQVSVLFTDFVGFTKIAESLTPQQLVQELHECFTAFDQIVKKHGIEKIKTIGDAYMAVSGLPASDQYHAFKAVNAAIEFLEFINERKKSNVIGFYIRIGIHSGPVIAGIVGTNKFAFDIWGDTVNIASRMESAGLAGQINISKVTYSQIKKEYYCQHRGKIEAKNKGEMDMYFVGPKLDKRP